MAPRTGRFRRADRLRRSAQFEMLKRVGRRASGQAFVVQVAQRRQIGALVQPRLGVTVSRKVGGAVVRNRVKRRVREWFRGHRDMLVPGLDLVVIGRPAAALLELEGIDQELCELVRKAGGTAGRGSSR